MKKKISLANIEGLLTIIFVVVIQNYVSDYGMGFFCTACCFVAFVSSLLFGGMKETVAKMVSIRMNRGMHNNARKVFKTCLLYTVLLGIVLNGFLWLFGDGFSQIFFHSVYPSIMIKLLGVLVVIRGLVAIINGFYMGIGNSSAVNISVGLYCIALVACAPFAMFFMGGYGKKVTALLNNQMFIPLYMLIGAVLALLAASLVSLLFLVMVYRRVTDHLNYNQKERGMGRHDSEKRVIRAVTGLRLKVCYEKIFLYMAGFLFCVIFMDRDGKAVVETAFSNVGIMFAKCMLPIAFVLLAFEEYIAKEKYMLHVDFNREEKRNVVLRSQYMIKNTGFLLLPIVIMLLVVTEPFLRILYSGDATVAINSFRLCIPLLFLLGLCVVLKGILSALGEKKASFIISAAAFLAHIIFALLFHDSMEKIFYAVYVFSFIHIAGHLVWMQRIIRMDWVDVVVKYLKVMLSCLAVTILEFILNHFVTMNAFLLVLSIVLGYFVFYVVMVLLRGISKKDATSLKGTIAYVPVSFISNKLGMW